MGEVRRIVPLGVVLGAARVVTPGAERDCGEICTRGHGMDGIRELLSAARDNGLAAMHFRGLLHVAIGRKITRPDGAPVSAGLTWRELAHEFKNLRFDPELVRTLGADPDTLAMRERERFWYAVIALAHVDSPDAVADADVLIPKLKPLGFQVGPNPAGGTPPAAPPPPPPPPKPKPTEPKTREKAEKPKETKPGKKKKK